MSKSLISFNNCLIVMDFNNCLIVMELWSQFGFDIKMFIMKYLKKSKVRQLDGGRGGKMERIRSKAHNLISAVLGCSLTVLG